MDKVTILGSGTFFSDGDITASSFYLEIGDKKILVDAGPGTIAKLGKIGIDPIELDYVFITHFHADHTSDLYPIFMEWRLSDLFEKGKLKKRPHIYGPKGINQFMETASELFDMHAYKGWDKIDVSEYPDEINLEGFDVKVFDADHFIFGHQAIAHCLRFEVGEKVLSISGDTVDCPGVRAAAKDADLFLCDASFPKSMDTKAHMNTHDIGKIARDENVKDMVLYHLYPQFKDVDIVGEIRDFYEGPVRKGVDLEVIEI